MTTILNHINNVVAGRECSTLHFDDDDVLNCLYIIPFYYIRMAIVYYRSVMTNVVYPFSIQRTVYYTI